MTKPALIILILILPFEFASGEIADTIFWKKDYFLKFKDFAGKPDSSKIDLANSYIWISCNYKIINNHILYTTNAYFLRSPSWAKLDWEPLLDHEQTHFDINALFAFKLLGTLQKSNLPISHLESFIKPIYNSITQQSMQMNDYYDKLEKDNASSGIPQQKLHKNIRDQIDILQKQIEKANEQQKYLQ